MAALLAKIEFERRIIDPYNEEDDQDGVIPVRYNHSGEPDVIFVDYNEDDPGAEPLDHVDDVNYVPASIPMDDDLPEPEGIDAEEADFADDSQPAQAESHHEQPHDEAEEVDAEPGCQEDEPIPLHDRERNIPVTLLRPRTQVRLNLGRWAQSILAQRQRQVEETLEEVEAENELPNDTETMNVQQPQRTMPNHWRNPHTRQNINLNPERMETINVLTHDPYAMKAPS